MKKKGILKKKTPYLKAKEFPFQIKEELTFPVDFAVQPPEQDGVKVLKMCWVQAKNINYKHKNLGRALGKRKESHVFTFKKIFFF